MATGEPGKIIVRMPVWRMRVVMAVAFAMWCLGARWWPDRIVEAMTARMSAWVARKFRIEH